MNWKFWALAFILTLLVAPVMASWEYATPGTQYWVAPAGVTNITLLLGGAGGSGHGGWTSGGTYLPGSGGEAGSFSTISRLSVTPGTNYTLVVGTAGATAAYGANGNAGTYSSAFGYYKAGGAGGTALTSGSAGTDGKTGFVNSTRYAVNGTAHAPFALGVSGLGYSAGGGGGSSDNVDMNTQGGAGAVGFVGIWTYGTAGGNTPDFTATPVTGPAGTLVTFTDVSTITDAAGLSYNWSFGDGSYSDTPGTVSHVYPYTGSYTVTLTLTSGGTTTVSEIKESYINLVTVSSQYILPVSPQPVRFNIFDSYGSAIPNANITVNYIASSLPNTSTSWLVSTFGVNATVASEMTNSGLAMRGWSGSDGSVSFIMYPVLQYGILITNTTTGLSKYVTIYPKDTDYNIYCTLSSQIPPTSITTYLNGSAIYVTEPNSSFVTFNVTYIDTSHNTANLFWNVTCPDNGTVLYSHDFGDPGVTAQTDSYTVSTSERGQEYWARYYATRTSPNATVIVGVSVITKGITGIMVPLGFETWTSAAQAKYCYNLISVCILFVIAAFSSPRKESTFLIIVPIFTGLLLWFGWIQLATASATTGFMFTVVVLGLLGVVLHMNDRNRELYGTGGPGSKLITTALFIAFFSIGLTLSSGFTIFPAGDIIAPPGTCVSGMACDTTFNNIDFSTMSGSLEQNYGLGGNVVSALAALPGITILALTTLINVVVGVLVFPVILNAVLEGIWHGITANPVYLLFLAALEVVILFIYITGIYELYSGRSGGTI
jgi:PKD repeat protein